MMVVDEGGNVIHADTEIMATYDELAKVLYEEEIDEDLGLEVVQKTTIFEKYGVVCDPRKNSFHASLHRQFEERGRLSEKQVNALRN